MNLYFPLVYTKKAPLYAGGRHSCVGQECVTGYFFSFFEGSDTSNVPISGTPMFPTGI